MAAPVVDAATLDVILTADGKRHSNPERWAGVEPFNVSVSGDGSPQFRVRDTAGVWGSWRSDTLSVTGTFVGSLSFSGTTEAELSSVYSSPSLLLTSEGHRLQLRATSSATNGDTSTVTWTVAGATGEWRITTVAPAGWNAGNAWAPTPLQGNQFVIPTTFAGTWDATAEGVQPGDTIIIAGGTHPEFQIHNAVGTALAPILITNEPGKERVVIRPSSGTFSSHIFQIWYSQHVIVDGLQEYTGATDDQVNYGILVTTATTGTADITSAVKGGPQCSDHTYRGIEVDGTFDNSVWPTVTKTIGIAFFGNYQAEDALDDPTAVRENFLYEYCNAHDVSGEGWYVGENRNTPTENPIPFRNITIRHCIGENFGRDFINTKFTVGGTTLVHDNVGRLSGTRAIKTSLENAQKMAINVAPYFGDCRIYNNKLYDSGLQGINVWYGAQHDSSDNTDPPVSDPDAMQYTCDIFNNLIVRTGVEFGSPLPDVGHGIRVFASNVTDRTLTANIYNNTIVDSLHQSIDIGTYVDTSLVRDNLIINNGTSPAVRVSNTVSSSGDTVEGNIEDTEAAGTESIVNEYSATLDGDYTPRAGTNLAVNTATNSSEPTTDIDGNARPFGVASDVGAYERQS